LTERYEPVNVVFMNTATHDVSQLLWIAIVLLPYLFFWMAKEILEDRGGDGEFRKSVLSLFALPVIPIAFLALFGSLLGSIPGNEAPTPAFAFLFSLRASYTTIAFSFLFACCCFYPVCDSTLGLLRKISNARLQKELLKHGLRYKRSTGK
jgi:hypothetical protein